MSVTSPALLLVRETWSHMSSVSGFDPLCHELMRRPEFRAAAVTVGRAEPRRTLWKSIVRRLRPPRPVPPAPSPFVESRHEALGREVLAAARRDPELRCFLSAGENQLASCLAQAEPSVKQRMYVCLHQPPSWFRLHWRDFSALSGLGGILCLGRKQEAYFKSLGLRTPVHRIHHGVVLDFFSPGDGRVVDHPPCLLVVGQWLRDFQTLATALPLIWKSRPDVTVECVIPQAARQDPALLRLAADSRVRWHAGISPEALRDLYRRADVLFLPLIDAVANNAIVEALACGVPVVTTDVGDMGDYLPREAGVVCPVGDATAHAEAVAAFLQDLAARRAAGRAARGFAEEWLQWPRIAENLVKILLTVESRETA